MAGIRMENKIYEVGMYCRLSKDDGTDNESASIATQKSILTDYVKKQGWHLAKTYVDDGYSGTNFQRPSFQNMIKDIESGLINCVITKDLSRLGRNYLDCGLYLEVFFPEHNVRYIAVNDGVDTLNKSAMDITPFRNILNEMYSADVSVKIKSAYRARFQQGKFMGTTAPYGYVKDPADHNHLLIDDKVAHVVREIFDLALAGNGIAKIRKHINKQHILRPAAYAAEQGATGYERYFEENEENRYIWSENSVRGILRSPIYAGNLAGYKRIAANMKSKKRPSKLPEEWEVIPDTHEGIVTQEEFDTVQQLITSRRLPENKGGFENIFAGVIKCADCGYAMRAMSANRRKRPDIIDCVQYSCNNYGRYGNIMCTAHSIEARDLFNAVLTDINRFADMAVNDEKAVRAIEKRLTETDQSKAKALEKEQRKLNKRLAELDRLFSSLYEDKVMERITERNFEMMSGKYQKEQLEIEARLKEVTETLSDSYEKTQGVRDFLSLIRNYQGIKELDATIINALIDKILVSEREKLTDGMVRQEIKIYYKFIGFVGELHITPTKRWTALKPKNCTVCGVEYVPRSGISKYCPACAKKIQREKSNESKRRSRERNRQACIELSAKNDRLRKAITYTGKDIPCTFTPEEDGYYTMESESLDGSYLDTYVDLMCDGDKIGENDEDAGNGNFCLIKKLEKGKEYTYLPRTYNEDTGSFIISFHKTNIVPIKNIEIVPREGVDISALTVIDNIRSYYDVKITYENGTTEITNWWDRKDAYGNAIDKDINIPEQTGIEKEVTYTVTVKYTNLGSDDEKEKKENITVKGIPSLEELKEANDYKITTFDRQYYRFTPSSEGQYIISLKQEDNDYNNVNVWTYGKLYDNQWETCIVEKAYEGENNYSVQLEAGREYLVSALGEVNNPEASFQIRKVKKTLKGLELVKAPEQAKCLPNDVNAVSYKGLQVKALYTDGSTETITYGNADSSGRYIYQGTVKWLDDGTGIAYANLGKYQVSFPLKADSWSNVPELKRDKATTVKAVRGDMVTLKFVPEKTDNYRFTVDGGYVVEGVVGEDPDDSCNNPGNCNLKEGKIYYIHVHAYKENPSVTVVYADCIWDVTSDTKATCTKEGKKVETCRKHGDTRVTVTPALGHKWNSGVITKKATCTADGVKTYTCSNCGEKKTEAIAKTGHKFSSWKKISDATVFAKQKQKRTCSICKKPDYRYVGSKVKATIKLNLTSITLQQKQSTKAVKVTMAKGDSVKSWTSSNKKIATVDKKGTIKAVKKGTAKITVTLKSGKKATVTVKVQTSKVATSKITGLKSKVTVKKGKTLTLKPVLSPITSKDKITYKTSNKSVATVSSKGVITGKKKGTAKITVKAGKKSYVVTVTVK